MYNAGLDLAATASRLEHPVRHRLHPSKMVPPIFHSVQRDTLKNPKQPGELGHRTVRRTWFEDDTSLHGQKPAPTQGPPQEMHGLKLMIREEIMPQDELPSFPA